MELHSCESTTSEPDIASLATTCVSYTSGMHVVGGLICMLIAGSNLLTIVTLLKSKESKRVGSKNRLYVISLACADLLVAPAFGLEMTLSQMGYLCHQGHAPININITAKRYTLFVLFAIRIMAFGVSFSTPFFIGVDRIVALSKPLWYKTNATCFRIKIILAVNWIYHTALGVSIMTYFAMRVPDYFVLKVYNFDTVLPANLYSYIILPQAYGISVPGNIISYLITYHKIKQRFAKKANNTKDLERTRRFFRMMLVSLVMLFALYTPFLVAFKMLGVGSPGNPQWVFTYVGQPVILLLISNSWISPVLYSCFNEDYRRAYFNVLGIRWNKVDESDVTSIESMRGKTHNGLN